MGVAVSAAPGCGGRILDEGHQGGTHHEASVPPHDSGPPEGGPLDVTPPVEAAIDAPRESATDVYVPPKGLVTIPLSGCIPEYTAPITVGGTTFQLVVDTGSTTMGVASSSCPLCSGVSPRYTPGTSAVDEHQTAMTQYQSGNTWEGEIYQDSVSAGSPTAMTSVKLVAIETQSTFFSTSQCGSTLSSYQGIIGLAPSGSAVTGTDGYFDDLVAGGFMPNVFATQLCPIGGTLWLGGYDPTHVTGPVQYVPMSSSFFSTYSYLIHLGAITIGGVTVTVPAGSFTDSVLDTGTSSFILNTAAFDAVTGAITRDPTFQTTVTTNPAWFNNPNNCIKLAQTKAELDAALPPMSLVYGTGPSVTVQAVATESYLFNYGGLWCPALSSYPSSGAFPFAAILGSPVLQATVTVFDRDGGRFGFAPHTPCP